jgi:hypothetical protein
MRMHVFRFLLVLVGPPNSPVMRLLSGDTSAFL